LLGQARSRGDEGSDHHETVRQISEMLSRPRKSKLGSTVYHAAQSTGSLVFLDIPVSAPNALGYYTHRRARQRKFLANELKPASNADRTAEMSRAYSEIPGIRTDWWRYRFITCS
jgi:hypothetical protein